MGLHWDNGKEHGNYRDLGFKSYNNGCQRDAYMGLYGDMIMENQMEKKMEHEMETGGM